MDPRTDVDALAPALAIVVLMRRHASQSLAERIMSIRSTPEAFMEGSGGVLGIP